MTEKCESGTHSELPVQYVQVRIEHVEYMFVCNFVILAESAIQCRMSNEIGVNLTNYSTLKLDEEERIPPQ